MGVYEALILGIIEGLTEFLPISSTGHLIVASHFLGLAQDGVHTAFEVIIQLAAIGAVTLNYKEKFHPKYYELWLKVLLAFLPIGIIGFLFSEEVKALFSLEVVAIMFIVGGVVFLAVERFYLKQEPKLLEDLTQISYKQSLLIGIAQIFALIPGTSRAGSTIIGALLVGLSRKASAEFSFLLALPLMGAVALYDLLKYYDSFASQSFTPLFVGFVTSFFVAYLSMKLFILFLSKFTFVAFGIYRILFGVLLLLI